MSNSDVSGRSIVIDRVFYDLFTSTGGTGISGSLTFYINPVESAGTDITPVNTNFGSTTSAVGTFKKGATGVTLFTGGTIWRTVYITDKLSMLVGEGHVVLPSGATFGISIEAPTGNTSMDVAVNVAFYYFDPELVG